MSVLSRHRRIVASAFEAMRKGTRLPTFETPVNKSASVSRRSLAIGLASVLAVNVLPKPAEAQIRAWARAKQVASGSVMLQMTPSRPAQGGTYDGTAGFGVSAYDATTQAMLYTVSTNPNWGQAITSRGERLG